MYSTQASSWWYVLAIVLLLTNIGMAIVFYYFHTSKQKSKPKAAPELSFDVEQPNMLNDHQVEEIVKKINGSVDIWGIPEWVEEKIIRQYVERVNAKMYPAMRHFFDDHWVAGMKILFYPFWNAPYIHRAI